MDSDIKKPDLVDIQVDVESEETGDGEREDNASGQRDTQSQATSNAAAAHLKKGKRPHSSQTHVAPALPRTIALTSNVWDHVTRFNAPDRKKLTFVQFCIEKMYTFDKAVELMGSINEAMRDLFEDYRRALGSEKGCEASHTSQTQGSTDLMDEGDDCGDAMQLFIRHQMLTNKTELDIYLQEEMKQQGAAFDVLSWWKLNGPWFPILSCLARDVLVVPVSTVASELAFSTRGKGSCEFDSKAESKDQTEMDNVCLDLTNISLEPNIDN
ncbi:hypothetical protein COLO4_05693 [Corchorus olitorius]|uniref:HAT C-terminal dimerisation domain-containing protein n=1 Tax=Corchorus olitorius TaxID=93759 RepID=A0A1R3KQ40_9ROSI|nr:hypothetical protein COLO4_05693 [Corchorus olitorius]